MSKKKLLLVTTVPETVSSILRGQPGFLNGNFSVSLATSSGVSVGEVRDHEGIPVYLLPMTRGINPLRDAYSLVMMVLLLLRLRPDAVHSYTPKAGLIAMLASRICFVSVRIHTFTGLIFPTQTGLKQKVLIFIDRLICACASKVVPEGEGVKKDLVKYSITKKPLEIIGHGNIAGVDSEYFSRLAHGVQEESRLLRESLSLPEDAFIFSFVGRLNKDKGVSELAYAFSSMPSDSHLLIVGGLDHTAPVLPEIIHLLNSNKRVHFLGFVRDIRPALYLSNILVLPSYREGFPNVILQAGAMQLPVIATDISGCNEVVTPSVNGWLVPSRDVAALQQAMQEALMVSRKTLYEMGDFSRKRIQSRFEQREHWLRMIEFYKKELQA